MQGPDGRPGLPGFPVSIMFLGSKYFSIRFNILTFILYRVYTKSDTFLYETVVFMEPTVMVEINSAGNEVYYDIHNSFLLISESDLQFTCN